MNRTCKAGQRAVDRCERLGAAPYSEVDGRLERPFLSQAHARAIEAAGAWMRQAGLATHIDPIGNLVGRLHAAGGGPTLIVGSHIDTVRDGGRYDGCLGVMIAIECAEVLATRGEPLPFALEVIAFGDEEGSRFPVSMMCSRALTGRFDPALLDLTDEAGVSLRQALLSFGLDPAALAQTARDPANVLGYLEAHIEQGPVLEAANLPIGVVRGIAGQLRLAARFVGMAGHAGTTPMGLRRDALAAAAEAVLAVEAICAAGGADLVGTVGKLETETSAFNVIVGAALIGVDIRAGSDAARDDAAEAVCDVFRQIAARRGLEVDIKTVQTLAASPCDGRLTDHLLAAVGSLGVSPMTLLSGAGHDAMTLAALAPTAMLFIRCAGGLSHHPAEAVSAADADLACRAMVAFVERLAEARA